jgi:hypothetical protein
MSSGHLLNIVIYFVKKFPRRKKEFFFPRTSKKERKKEKVFDKTQQTFDWFCRSNVLT